MLFVMILLFFFFSYFVVRLKLLFLKMTSPSFRYQSPGLFLVDLEIPAFQVTEVGRSVARRYKLPSNHDNFHLGINYQQWNHGYFVVYKSIHHHTNQMKHH